MRAIAAIVGVLLVAAIAWIASDPALRGRIVQVRPSPSPALAGDPATAAGTTGARRPVQAPQRPPPRADAAPSPSPQAPAAVAPTAPSPSPSTTALAIPVDGIAADQLVDTFEQARGEQRRHEALDSMAPAGTPVRAVADGHIEKLFDSARGGLTIYQFDPDGRHAYYYAHLQDYAPGLAEKQAVTRGQLLGHVGSTGNADPAAPHLHFAIFVLGPERHWWQGTPINPYPRFHPGT